MNENDNVKENKDLENVLSKLSSKVDNLSTQVGASDRGNDKSKPYYEYANELIEAKHIIRIGESLYYYDEDHYKLASPKDIRRLVYNAYKDKGLNNKNKRNEVIECIDLEASISTNAEPYLISFNNGILDISKIETKQGEEPAFTLDNHTPDKICVTKLPYDFTANTSIVKSKPIQDAMKIWTNNDKELETLIYEMIGYLLVPNTNMHSSFIFTGQPSCGKSTFFDVIEHLIPLEYKTSVTLKELGQQFTPKMLENKLVSICADLDEDNLDAKSTGMLKKIASGDRIKIEPKGVDAYTIRPTCKLLFSCNDLPTYRDTTGALYRRLRIIPFEHKFTKSNRDIDFINKVTTKECMEYLIYTGLICYTKAKERGSFTLPKRCEELEEEQRRRCNSVLRWVHDRKIDFNNPDMTAVEYYENYINYCGEMKYYQFTQENFKTILQSNCNVEYKNKRLPGGKNVQKTYVSVTPTNLTMEDIKKVESEA